MLVGCYYERQANDETNVRDSNKYKTIIVKNKFINTHTLRYLEMLRDLRFVIISMMNGSDDDGRGTNPTIMLKYNEILKICAAAVGVLPVTSRTWDRSVQCLAVRSIAVLS